MLANPRLIAVSSMFLAAFFSVMGAFWAANAIEARAAREARHALSLAAVDWAEVSADGLQLRLSGQAPTEAERFKAISALGTIVDAARVVDTVEVPPSRPLAPPRFSMELLRNEAGVSMIGLVPAGEQRNEIIRAARSVAGDAPITELLESTHYPAPGGWTPALDFGLEALALLDQSKISVSAGAISITAIADSEADKQALEDTISARLPDGLVAQIDISAPRPVVTPYRLRYVLDQDGGRFESCVAQDEAGRDATLKAAEQAGLAGPADCVIGLGAPSADWDSAAARAIAALGTMGHGTLTMTGADMELALRHDVETKQFDAAIGDLETNLPPAFSLKAWRRPAPAGENQDAAEAPQFSATLSPEGTIQMRGRVPDAATRKAALSYGHARFPNARMHAALRVDDTLPEGWPKQVLTGLSGLSELHHGMVLIQPDKVTITGKTGDQGAPERLAALYGPPFAGEATINVAYDEALDPLAALPSPADCIAQINTIQATEKIRFEPGSITVEGPSQDVVDQIADVLRDCPQFEMEISGHTDSQGREEMNLSLSQARAEAVLNALMARRILTSQLSAKGYGETQPIADNKTDAGREANRRIEFRLSAATAQGDSDAAGTVGAPDQDSTTDETDAPSSDGATTAGEDDEQD